MIMIPAFRAGRTFSYAGVVSGLERSSSWSAKASVRDDNPNFGFTQDLTVLFAKAADWATSGDYTLSLTALPDQTGAWKPVTVAPRILICDIKFATTDNPPVVTYSDPFRIEVVQPVTL